MTTLDIWLDPDETLLLGQHNRTQAGRER